MSPHFDNSYAQLPERFYARQSPVPVADPGLIRINHVLARQLDIDPAWLESEEGVNTIAGNHVPDGADPIAMVYAGHQFGSWNPRLGDGRAILLGEVIDADGERYDIQLKGSGITPFSRSGDGRAPLGPILREYLVSEAMAALGVPSSRTLAAVTTGESVYREAKLAGAVLIRVAKSHIRFGTLQYFASVQDLDGLQLLIDHVIARHYPAAADADNPAQSLFEQVAKRLAELVAYWQSVGFIHGVMNTDNMLLSGETIDFGPCAFMDGYDSAAVYSSIDHGSRYAYSNQPAIAHWNLSCLAQTLLPFFAEDTDTATKLAQAALETFPGLYQAAYLARMRLKFGLTTADTDDEVLIQDFLDLLESGHHDFTLAFRRLGELPTDRDGIKPLFDFPESFTPWLERWQERCTRETIDPAHRREQMLTINPAFIARNHLVEKAIAMAYDGDFSFFHRLLERVEQPFDYSPNDASLAKPPSPDQIVQQTFCGT